MQCRVCDSTNLQLAVDLGYQPWCNNFLTKEEIGKELVYPLRLFYCHDCTTPQLDYTVKKEIMFGSHTYLSGVTQSLSEHFRSVAETVDSKFFRDVNKKAVLDIGSNDGTQLKHFKALGYDVLGVESAAPIARIANDAGIPTVHAFFDLDIVRRLARRFHVINAAGVFFHLEELHAVTDGVRELLREDGVFVVQCLYMKRIVENLAFDQIYHEHLLYYNLENLEILLNRHGLAMFGAYLSPIHGGSIIGFATHRGKRSPSRDLKTLRQEERKQKTNKFSTYVTFSKQIERMKVETLAYLDYTKSQGQRIFGFGAPAKGNTLLNAFRIGCQYLDCLVEKNKLRRGLYSPGMHLPIVIEDELMQLPDLYFVLAWNYKREILANNRHLMDKGVKFHFPVNPKE